MEDTMMELDNERTDREHSVEGADELAVEDLEPVAGGGGHWPPPDRGEELSEQELERVAGGQFLKPPISPT
jgi:hypothetical protein